MEQPDSRKILAHVPEIYARVFTEAVSSSGKEMINHVISILCNAI
jgi:hypothetical protein